MSLIVQAKRAGKDHNIYTGETEDFNWEPSHAVMWMRLCDRFGGYYTLEPTRAHQNQDFLEFIDNYKDREYTAKNDDKINKTKPGEIRHAGGYNLKNFMPERKQIAVPEGASKAEIKTRDAVVNQNADVKIPASMQKPKSGKAPEPRQVVAVEKTLESDNPNANDAGKTEQVLDGNIKRDGEVSTSSSSNTDVTNRTGEANAGETTGKPIQEIFTSGRTENSTTTEKLESDNKTDSKRITETAPNKDGSTTEERTESTSSKLAPQTRTTSNSSSTQTGGSVKVRG